MALFAAPEAYGQDEWDLAAEAVVRLAPAAVPGLPFEIRAELERLGCTIPQAWYRDEPHNVVRGHFASADQVDWAVLCSRAGESEIRVFWGGPVHCPATMPGSLVGASDRSWLQGVGGGKIGYSRVLRGVDRTYILRMHEVFGGPAPPELEHEGIEEYFIEKASMVWYCHEGTWLTLTGID
jgi:hypothetical protein